MELNDQELLNVIAAKIIAELDDDKKQRLIEIALQKQLKDWNINWAVKKQLEKEAQKIAGEIVTTTKFQQKIRGRVKEILDEKIDEVIDCVGGAIIRAFRGTDTYPNSELGKLLDKVKSKKKKK